MSFAEPSRGDIRIPRFARRARTFAGLRFGNITPTDIDCSFDFQGNLFVFVEGKTNGGKLDDGQRRHLEYLVKGLRKGGKGAFAIVIGYPPGETEVSYASCVVERFFSGGVWCPGNGETTLVEFVQWILAL